MIVNKKVFYAIIAVVIITLSYFTIIFSEEELISPKNIDKFIQVKSVTYIPNGRNQARCQIICADEKGFEYHIIDSDTHFVGDIIDLYEYHGRLFIYLTTFGMLMIFVAELLMLLIILTQMFGSDGLLLLIIGDFKLI